MHCQSFTDINAVMENVHCQSFIDINAVMENVKTDNAAAYAAIKDACEVYNCVKRAVLHHKDMICTGSGLDEDDSNAEDASLIAYTYGALRVDPT